MPNAPKGVFVLILMVTTCCVQPRSSEQTAADLKTQTAQRQEMLHRIAAWKASAITASDIYDAYERDERNAARLFTNQRIAVKGAIKNITWHNGIPEVSLFIKEGVHGTVTCMITVHSASIGIVQDLDYTKLLYMVGTVRTGIVLPRIERDQKMITILLRDCEVLPVEILETHADAVP